jgi:DNA-binding beta-propeller fold protein YncE
VRIWALLLLVATAGCRPAPQARSTPPPLSTAPAALPEPAVVALARPTPVVREGAAVAVARIGARTLAFVSDAETGRLHAVDVDSEREIASAAVPGAGAVVVLADGRIAVASRTRDEVVVLSLVEGEALRVERTFRTGREPSAIALTADDRTLLVTSAIDRTLEAFATAGAERRAVADLPDAPSAVIDGPDGRALVAYTGASDVTAVETRTGAFKRVSLDTSGEQVEPAGTLIIDDVDGKKAWTFGNGMATMHLNTERGEVRLRARHANAFAAANEYAYVAHELMVPSARTAIDQQLNPSVGYGGSDVLTSSENLGVSILERKTGKRISFHRANTTCRLPRGQVFDAKQKQLLVACAGDNSLVALAWSANVHTSNGYTMKTLTPSYNETRRVALPGPSDGVALDADHDRVVVSMLFGGAVVIVDLKGSAHAVVALSGQSALPDDVARGRLLFHRSNDPRIAADGRACASCHLDGLGDGLVWKTPRGPRSTPVLAGRIEREGAFGWNGQNDTLSAHIALTIKKNLGGKGLSARDAADLAAYLRAMPAPSVPRRSELALRGEAIFNSDRTGCASCHAGPRASDGERHDVRSKGLFLTPSLIGLSRSSPYFHDGRYRTLDELLTKTDGAMGTTHALPADDRAALRAYLGSL